MSFFNKKDKVQALNQEIQALVNNQAIRVRQTIRLMDVITQAYDVLASKKLTMAKRDALARKILRDALQAENNPTGGKKDNPPLV